MTTGAEIPDNIINGLLSDRKYGTERVEQFMKKGLLSREVSFHYRIQRSSIATSSKKKTKKGKIRPQRKPPAVGLFIEK